MKIHPAFTNVFISIKRLENIVYGFNSLTTNTPEGIWGGMGD